MNTATKTRKARPWRISAICRRYARRNREAKATRDEIDSKIARLERKVEQLKKERGKGWASWINEIIAPIARKLEKHYPDRRAEILGPFGLCSEVSIHLYKKDIPEADELRDCKSITFVRGDLEKGEIRVRDYSRDTGRYKPGTMGELNGMNHPEIEIPAGAGIEWLVEHIERAEDRTERRVTA